MKEYRDDVRARAAKAGRNPDDIKVLFTVSPMLAETRQAAQDKMDAWINGPDYIVRTLAGIIEPDRGRLTRARVTCQLLSLSVGFMQHLSGRDNAILSGLMLGLRRREILQRLPKILEFSELGAFF